VNSFWERTPMTPAMIADSGDQCDEGQLPRHDEHHRRDAQHGEHRLDQLRERLLQRLLDVVDVVGDPRHQVAALAGVEVAQRQPVELLLDVLAEVEDDPHYQAVEDETLGPGQHRRDGVHGQDDEDQPAEHGEVDALTGHDGGSLQHVGELVVAVGAGRCHNVGQRHPLGQLHADDAVEDGVHRLAEDLRRQHREHH
jgi:hypothetical protein